jgi:hypothetical protein
MLENSSHFLDDSTSALFLNVIQPNVSVQFFLVNNWQEAQVTRRQAMYV